MIESTKPITDTDDEPEILARYTKVLPKGQGAVGATNSKSICLWR